MQSKTYSEKWTKHRRTNNNKSEFHTNIKLQAYLSFANLEIGKCSHNNNIRKQHKDIKPEGFALSFRMLPNQLRHVIAILCGAIERRLKIKFQYVHVSSSRRTDVMLLGVFIPYMNFYIHS